MNNNIILIGMPASGKSTVGVILAKVLGYDFIDTDIIIQNKTGKKLSQIISEDGLDGFMKIEEEVCCGLYADNSVIATGGSVIYGQKAMEHFKEIGKVVYLEINFEDLEKRLHHMKQRGVVLKKGQTKRNLYDERVKLYRKFADVTILEEGQSIEETVQACISALS